MTVSDRVDTHDGVRPAPTAQGMWIVGTTSPAFHGRDVLQFMARPRLHMYVVRAGERGRIGVASGGQVTNAGTAYGQSGFPLLATLLPLFPEWLGDRSFLDVHGVRFSYIAGEMANGIATARMVVAMAQAGMLRFFGATGLSLERIEQGELDKDSTVTELVVQALCDNQAEARLTDTTRPCQSHQPWTGRLVKQCSDVRHVPLAPQQCGRWQRQGGHTTAPYVVSSCGPRRPQTLGSRCEAGPLRVASFNARASAN